MRLRLIPGGIALLLGGCGLSVVGTAGPPDSTLDASALDVVPDANVADGAADAEADAPIDVYVPCEGGPLECCGGSACPAGTTQCVNNTCVATLDITARIDGYSNLLLQGSSVWWHHLQFDAPTSVKLNGTTFSPGFPPSDGTNNTCNCDSKAKATLTPPIAAHPQAGLLTASTGRGSVTLLPATVENGNTLTVQFSDPDSNAGNYTATVQYQTR